MEFKSFTCPCCRAHLVRAYSSYEEFVCRATKVGFSDVFRSREGAVIVVTDNSDIFKTRADMWILRQAEIYLESPRLSTLDAVSGLSVSFPDKEFKYTEVRCGDWWARVILYAKSGEVQDLETRIQAASEGKLWEVIDSVRNAGTQQIAQNIYQAIEQHVKEMR